MRTPQPVPSARRWHRQQIFDRERSVGDPHGWHGRPPRHGTPVTCHNDPGAAKLEPDQSLILPGTPHYGTVRADAWYPVHPVIHGDRGWFKDNWHGQLPILRGTLPRVVAGRLPDGRRPHKTLWLWHAGPPRCRQTSCGAPTSRASTKRELTLRARRERSG